MLSSSVQIQFRINVENITLKILNIFSVAQERYKIFPPENTKVEAAKKKQQRRKNKTALQNVNRIELD